MKALVIAGGRGVRLGPVCENWEEVLENVQNFEGVEREYRQERRRVRKLFCGEPTGKSCQEIFTKVVALFSSAN